MGWQLYFMQFMIILLTGKKMFSKLKEILSRNTENSKNEEKIDLKLAITVILFEVVLADDEFSDDEKLHFYDTMQTRFEIKSDEIDDLIAKAESARAESSDIWQFSNKINETLDRESKRELLVDMWELIYVDGVIDSHEDYFLHKMTKLFNMSNYEMISAKLEAKENMGLSS
jgi:uncharacterized tellurite resistance protein B-like protein